MKKLLTSLILFLFPFFVYGDNYFGSLDYDGSEVCNIDGEISPQGDVFYAFDEDLDTCSADPLALNENSYIGVEFSVQKQVKSIQYTQSSAYPFPDDLLFNVQYSDDGETWYSAGNITIQQETVYPDTQNLSVEPYGYHYFWQIIPDSSMSGYFTGSTNFWIDEILFSSEEVPVNVNNDFDDLFFLLGFILLCLLFVPLGFVYNTFLGKKYHA